FTFDQAVDVASLEIVDFDFGNTDGMVKAYDGSDNLIKEQSIYAVGDNGYQKVVVSATGVRKLEVVVPNSFSIAGLNFCDEDLPSASISDLVWNDANGDGAAANEAGLPNVKVNLFDNGNNLLAETYTDMSGIYTFPNLPTGEYRVAIEMPAGFTGTADLDGDGDNDSGVFTLAANENKEDVDFGLTDGSSNTQPDGCTGSASMADGNVRNGAANHATGAPDGITTEVGSNTDFLVVTLSEEIAAGTAYTIYMSGRGGAAVSNVFEAPAGTAVPTSHQNSPAGFTQNGDARVANNVVTPIAKTAAIATKYLYFVRGSGDIEIDAVTFECASEGNTGDPVDITPIDCNNLLTNEEFDDNTNSWWQWSQNGNSANFTIDNGSQLSGNKAAKIGNINIGNGTDWHVQLGQSGKSITAGKEYTLSFEAKAQGPRSMTVIVQEGNPTWATIHAEQIALTTDGTTYSYAFTSDVTIDGNVNVVFFLGQSTETVWIDNVFYGETCGESDNGAGDPSPEVCDNGIDDDGDGFTDDDDLDCNCMSVEDFSDDVWAAEAQFSALYYAAQGRIGDNKANGGIYEMNWHQVSPHAIYTETDFVWGNGTTYPFTIVFDPNASGNNKLIFTLGEGSSQKVQKYDPTAWPIDFDGIWMYANATKDGSYARLENMNLNGAEVPDMSAEKSRASWLIRTDNQLVGGFTLTGDITQGWVGNPPTQSNINWNFKIGKLAAPCGGTVVTPEICGNGIDDDNNGLTDCNDPNCADYSSCKVDTCSARITNNLVALYNFKEATGDTVYDVSGAGTPLNLAIDNTANTSWIGDCGLTISDEATIQSAGAATKITDAIQASNAITIETWVKAANTTQDGPARIVTLSSGSSNRNFTLGQEDDKYAFRLRTNHGSTDSNGNPTREEGSVYPEIIQHVVYTWDQSTATETIYVDGVVAYTGTRNGNTSNWNDSYKLAIGNELSASRPWLGDIYMVAIYDKALSSTEVENNYEEGHCCTGLPEVVPDISCEDGRDVEFIYTGLKDAVPATLSINDVANVDSIVVEIIYKGGDPGNTIQVQDAAGNSYSGSKVNVALGARIYRMTLPATSAVSYTNENQESKAQSIAAYVFRSGQIGKTYVSKIVNLGGHKTTKYINFPLPTRTEAKDIVVNLPVSEVTYDDRGLEFSATAGGVTTSVQRAWGPNSSGLPNGCCMDVIELRLEDVPTDARNLTVAVTSPNSNGQSFVVTGLIFAEIQCVDEEICDNGIDDDNDGLIDCDDPDCNNNIAVTAMLGKATICSGESTILTATATGGDGSYTFSWNNSLPAGINQMVDPTTTTTYEVTVTDGNGCTAVEQITLTVNDCVEICDNGVDDDNDGLVDCDDPDCSNGLQVTASLSEDVICDDQSATLSASATGGDGNYTFTWDNSLPNGTSHTINPTATTTYEVMVTDGNGCQAVEQVVLTVENCNNSPEICDNGIDDDGDGLIDCFDPDCAASGTAITVIADIGVSNENNALGAADGNFAKVYDSGDRLTLDLGVTIPAGDTYSMVWRRKSSYGNTATADMVIEESADNTNWTTNPTEPKTSSKSFITSQVTANVNTRYIRIREKTGSNDDFDIDAVTYNCVQIVPEVCDDGVDNDGDGLVDGDDPDCMNCPTGAISFERFDNINGGDIDDLTDNANYPNNPTESGIFTSLQGPTNSGSNYGTRVRGFVHPTETGNYTFTIVSDDASEVYLSTDDHPNNKVKIAEITSWTPVETFDKFDTQKSDPIVLAAGTRYYIEVLHKESGGGDHLALYWQTPSNDARTIIAGSYLSPFGCGVQPEVCGDNIDNDGDGLTDCEDPDCGAPTIIEATAQNPTNCPDANNGVIEINATGDNLEYSIDGGSTYQSSNRFENLTAGNYTVYVINKATGCTADLSNSPVNLTAPDCSEICDDNIDNDGDGLVDCEDPDCGAPFIVDANADNPTNCPAANNGVIEIDANGENLAYSIDGGATYQSSSRFENLSAGVYNVFVINTATGCTDDLSTSLVELDAPDCTEICNDGIDNDGDGTIDCEDGDCGRPVINSVQPSNTTCPSLDNGQIMISATGDNLEYSISTPANYQASSTFTGLVAGSYTISVRSTTHNCEVTFDTEVVIANPESCAEVCDNGIDDDGDGDIDNCDGDCNPYANPFDGCITVNSTGDEGDANPGDGKCLTVNCDCTLRAAIEEANAFAGKDTICFDIPGPGMDYDGNVWTITPMSFFADLSEAVFIDGFTQTGSASATDNSPAVLKIKIDGSNLPAEGAVFKTTADGSKITGLIIGGNDAADASSGVTMQSANNEIVGNYIGVREDGETAFGNGRGVVVNGSNNRIGGPNAADGNIIAQNDGAGVEIVNTGNNGNTVLRNSFTGNGGIAIDLSSGNSGDAVTENDENDGDDGANNLLNFPELVGIAIFRGNVYYDFVLDVPAGDYRIEFFSNDSGDPSGHGEGETFIGAMNVNHTGSGEEVFYGDFTPLMTIPVGTNITLTATQCTDGTCSNFYQTSEFNGLYVAEKCNDLTDPGSIEGDEEGCGMPFSPSTIISLSEGSGGEGGPVYYQWQFKEIGSSIWQDIVGATGVDYTPAPINLTTSYRRRAIRARCSATW
ncbi:MAG: choice-of-anchor W domain-containing protein, partial [Bacteroidota bacterium]